jgi:hypothetical protein
MDLARAEYLARQPPNWGKIIHEKLLERENIVNNNKHVLAISSRIQKALDDNPGTHSLTHLLTHSPNHLLTHSVVSGPLQGSEILKTLNEQEQCEFFSRYSNCKVLILRNWTFLSGK